MNITVVGTGYVGMSMCVLLSRQHNVLAYDIDAERIACINRGQSTVADKTIEIALQGASLQLQGTTNSDAAYKHADFIIVATPTNYDEALHHFDTSSLEQVIQDVNATNPDALVIIKSTVPVGFTKAISQRFGFKNIIFSPEFLREGSALRDNEYPSRIVVGEKSERGQSFANLLVQACKKSDVSVLLTSSNEAEAIKLFANNYLAMRVAFFNELDTYAETVGLNTEQIIRGVGLDPRIGMEYHNPSFGYGGYCLPKDTKQLSANMAGTNCALIPAIVEANVARKMHIVQAVLKTHAQVIGIYKLAMKTGSDNHRSSAVFDIIKQLQSHNVDIIVYDPSVNADERQIYEVVTSLSEFAERADIILANRVDDAILFAQSKIYTRDIYHYD